MPLKFELQLKQDVITGFSYSFAKALLLKLCELHNNDKLWTYYDNEGEKKVEKQTELTQNIIHYLNEQIPYCDWRKFDRYVGFSRKQCSPVLADAENFLKTFEPKFKLNIKYIYKD